jgi:hypothetical protein
MLEFRLEQRLYVFSEETGLHDHGITTG